MVRGGPGAERPADHGTTAKMVDEFRRLTTYLGLLPVVAFPFVVLVLYALEKNTPSFAAVFEPAYLLPAANTAFLALMPCVVAVLAGRSYLARGHVYMLLLGSGLLVFGAGNLVAGLAISYPGPNSTVTIHNVVSLVAGLLQIWASLSLAGGTFDREPPRRRGTLVLAYAGALVFVGLLSAATVLGYTPAFFVPGRGATPLRQVLLTSAVLLYTVPALFALRLYRQRKTRFLYWYGLALILIATGLAAVSVQGAVGSAVGWAGRLSQYLGGVYFLIAVIATARRARERGVTVEETLEEFFRDPALRYWELVRTAPDAIIAVDAEGRVLIWNPAAERIFGYSQSEAVGVQLADLILPGGRGSSPALFVDRRPGTRESDTVAKELTLRNKKAVEFPAEVAISPGGPPAGNAATLVIRDITSRKVVEQALARERDFVSAVLSTAWALVVVLDREGRIIRFNRRCEQLTGYSFEEVKGTPFWDIFLLPEEADEVKGVFALLRAGSFPNDHENFWVAKDGSRHLISWSNTALLAGDGSVEHVVAIGIDVTARRLAEDALRRTRDQLEVRVQERTAELTDAYERLEQEVAERSKAEAQLRQAQKMEALGTLAGGIAHDFNNLLAAMIGFTELASDHASAGSPQERHLKRVLEAGLRGREVIRQILTFSRKGEQEKKPIRLSSAIRECMALLRASIPANVRIRLEVGSESGLILGDSVQIEQVLVNLCSNAAHAMRETGGTLYVELSDHAGPSHVSEGEVSAPYMKLLVRDTGSGIPHDVIDRVFDPFFTTKSLGEGTGLGLSVVHGIVTQHGGYITVESAPGKGSTFAVYLPMVAEEHHVEPVLERAMYNGSERLLLVDDEEALTEIGRDFLEQLGYDVTVTNSSQEALALFRADPGRFDLVVTDQTMPGMTGLELARQLTALRPSVPIVLATGFSHSVDAKTASEAGVRGFVMKPLTKAELAQAVRTTLDGE